MEWLLINKMLVMLYDSEQVRVTLCVSEANGVSFIYANEFGYFSIYINSE